MKMTVNTARSKAKNIYLDFVFAALLLPFSLYNVSIGDSGKGYAMLLATVCLVYCGFSSMDRDKYERRNAALEEELRHAKRAQK